MGRWLDRLAELQAARDAGEGEHLVHGEHEHVVHGHEEGSEAAGERPRRTGLLRLVRHEHRCRCGRTFKCTAPSCADRTTPCVVCRLDRRGR